jgi:hypothetical protein
MKNKQTKYITTKDIVVKKGTVISENGDGKFDFVLGYGKDFAQLIQVTDMEGLFAENLLEEVKD